MVKVYSLNQEIKENCYSKNIIDVSKINNTVSLNIFITEEFNNVTGLEIKYQASKDKEFIYPIYLFSQRFCLANLKLGVCSNIKFLLKNNIKYTRLIFTIFGNNPTQGKITATLEEIK